MQYREILDQLRTHVASLFLAHKDERFVYHNLHHTEQVVENAVRIANHYQLSDREFFIVTAASWFHDMGYLFDCSQHEVRGERIATEFLTEKEVDKETIALVGGCILATKMPQSPVGLLQQIVCDADLFHLGSDSFKEKNKLMRQEVAAFCNKEIDKNEWRIKTIALFKAHHYHTDFCQQLLNNKKAQNLAEMEKKLITPVEGGTTAVSTTGKKKKGDKPERGVETMFRVSSGNHQRLSDMADNKAHIMISTNSIILSVILSLLLRKLEDNPHLIIPTLLLLIVCVVTMVFSILATRPSIPEGIFTPADIEEKRVNLLFFGNFYRMSLSDYESGMLKMMDDRDFLYGSLIKDVYSQGVVLGRKYRLLRIAYNVFMFGIVAAVLAFIIASAIVTM
ncbi:Predicted metal-dependent phosphohydrolase, HD superfamily [Pedobacter sp. ok626]|uniref:Pycsar system effector family protein n=1 Tax=Pedobacter sp. ok626 TaxID=1761882 RepID=UPI0008861679|nr:Pycsar system effector family protein [Pedobacter sp. ok626]SDL04244.1 Predicted metal-dependent phosphohydrolase, HD superfamily [Pedobacter sp. ok626]